MYVKPKLNIDEMTLKFRKLQNNVKKFNFLWQFYENFFAARLFINMIFFSY